MSGSVKTWRERLGLGPAYPLHGPTDVERAMVAEIAELRAVVEAQAARAIDTFVAEPFALVPGYHMDCERPALACFTGSEYEFADGDRYGREGDTLAGFPAEFLTLHRLEKRLAIAPDRIQIAIAALRAGLAACAETIGRRQADHVCAVHDKVIAEGRARLSGKQNPDSSA